MSPRKTSRVITFTVVTAAVLLLQCAYGQGRGGTTGTTSPGGTSTGSTTGTGTGRGTTNPTPTQPAPTQQQPAMQQPIFVSGRVVMEDGGPLPEPVVIERVCGGNPRSEGYTDSKGYFSVELGGRNNSVLRDASESPGGDFGSGMGGSSPFPGSSQSTGPSGFGGMSMDNRFMNCDLRARLAGFRSQTVSLANRRPLDNPDIGVILLHRLGSSEGGGSTISASMLAAPKDARKAYDKGMDGLKKRKPEEALKNFQKAVELSPTLAPAWYEIGRLQMQQKQQDDARKSFESAVKSDAKFVPPYLEIAVMDAQAQKWKEVADTTDQIVKLNSFDYPQAFFYNAVANYNLQNMDQAEKSARQAEKLDTRHQMPKASQLLGVILYQRRDLTGAAESFRNYLKFAPTAPDVENVRKDLDQIEKATAQVKQ